MALRVRRSENPPAPKPWQRALAGVGVLGVLVLATLIVTSADANHTSWSKHLTGASALLFVLGGVFGAIAAPRVSLAIVAGLGWIFPAALVWLGVEYWTNWHAFYSPGGHHPLTSENDARVAGSLMWLFALFAGSFWFFVLRGVLAQRRSRTDASAQA